MQKDREDTERERKPKQIINKYMVNEYFKQQDRFLAELIEAHQKGFFSAPEYSQLYSKH